MAVSQTILERVYTKVESAWGTAATLAGANKMNFTKCAIEGEQGDIPSNDKTGTISEAVGAAGPRGGRWSLEWEARPNGTAAVVPDCDPIFQATWGQAATVVPSTSVEYSFANLVKSITIGRYRDPNTVMQQLLIGGVVQELQFAFAQNANCKITASGTGLFAPDSITFGSLDAGGKGGLGSFPAEPGSGVTNGEPVNGLAGSASLDGSTAVQIRDANIRVQTAIECPRDRLFAGQYPSAPERDKLRVFMDLVIVDEDIAGVTNLYTKALTRTRVPIVLTAGATAGSRFQFTAASVLLPMPSLSDDARKWAANLRNMRCYPTTSTALDELKLKIY